MCSNSGAMGVRRARSNTRNEPSHAPVLALLRTSDLVMSSGVGPLNDVHGPLDHERHAASSLQGARALILGQPPRPSLTVLRSRSATAALSDGSPPETTLQQRYQFA